MSHDRREYDPRFQTPEQGVEYDNEYDIPSSEIQDLISRGVAPVKVLRTITGGQLDLASAGTLLLDPEPGYGFAFYVVNTATGLKYSEALITVYINRGDAQDLRLGFPAKPNRGYRGAFNKLYLVWPADTSGTYEVAFYIFKSRQYPWIGGQECN